MAASPASYATLGVPPGADRAAIDRAYRALMKLHHPDLGGDAQRAASINRAYAEITRAVADVPGASIEAGDLAAALYERRRALRASRVAASSRKRPRWPLWVALVALAGGAGWVEREPLADLAWSLEWRYFPPGSNQSGDAGAMTATSSVSQEHFAGAPLDPGLASAGARAARATLARGGIGAAAETSRTCYFGFQNDPTLARYDRCVAFDDAVVLSAVGAGDRGGFSAGAVTARQLAAGRMLNGDYESIEVRLDRIRLTMTRALAASEDTSGVAPVGGVGN